MDQFLVEGEVRCNDADDLRRVGGDQLFAKRIRAENEIVPGLDTLDHSAAGDTCNRHPIAACQLARAPFLQAIDRFPVGEQHLEMPPVRGEDDARLRRAERRVQARSCSALAAQTTSSNVTPPAECVEYVTTQRL